jgi:hypothetical protein
LGKNTLKLNLARGQGVILGENYSQTHGGDYMKFTPDSEKKTSLEFIPTTGNNLTLH